MKIPFHFPLGMCFNSEQEKKDGIFVSSLYEKELFLIFWSSFLEACKYDSLYLKVQQGIFWMQTLQLLLRKTCISSSGPIAVF